MSSNIRVKRICQYCSKEFIAKTTVTKHCSDQCAKRAYKQKLRDKKIESTQFKPKTFVENKINGIRLKEISERDFLSIEQAAIITGISRMTLYRLTKKGDLPVKKIGARSIILRRDINQLLGL
jgi:excisionase family DNA binding protein